MRSSRRLPPSAISGVLTSGPPGADAWKTFAPGDRFEVPGNGGFPPTVTVETAHLCEHR
ncbi:pyrimidine/purine nucleoside phosphorylase [Streptomyces sp. cmx-4-25]|uniref:pyrimidine/purine nucleoside phosphorylase n=1 Tax=unclassified Streptomyces TaxID=2593676 RepID=UPI00397F6F2C